MKTTVSHSAKLKSIFTMDLSKEFQTPELETIDFSEITFNKMPEIQNLTQQRYFKQKFPNAESYSINYKNNRIGKVILNKSFTYHLVDISILSKYRNLGIGTIIMENIICSAKSKKKNVTLTVDVDNSAVRLFKRLGFKIIIQDQFYLKMSI